MSLRAALIEVNNAVLDLQSADYNTFERPLQRLSQALALPELSRITEYLKTTVDLDAIVASSPRGGSMIGSDRLSWPGVREQELGLAIQIIQRGAQNPEWFSSFAHQYFHSGSNITRNIRKITSAVIIPFNRDFRQFIESVAPISIEDSGDSREEAGVSGMTLEKDKDDLLEKLVFTSEISQDRTSIEKVVTKYFPEWGRERMLSAAEALIKDQSILNLSGPMMWVDISSTARKKVEGMKKDRVSSVIYNINEMHNSPIQHVDAGGHGSQVTNYSNSSLREAMDFYKQHVEQLGLDAAERRRADSQVATIEAQLMDEPDPSIVKRAGRTLKTIIERALGRAAENAISNASLWQQLIQLLS